MGLRRYGLRDDQWDRIKDFLPGRSGTEGRPARDNRLFVEAVLYRYRAGIPWRDLPERFGDFRVVHTRFTRWSERGIWKHVLEHLSRDANKEYAMIDATILRAHQHARELAKRGGKQALGRSKGGLSTKIHVTVDALGNPTGVHLTGGQACELDGADVLLPQLQARIVIADKGFDAEARVLEPLREAGKQAVIPPRAKRLQPRTYDKELYKARHLIENFLRQTQAVGAIATRYDKTARNFLAAIHLACAYLSLV
ncbi:IS5 family transposase [Tunturiibacter gelidiferens]|uniref:IS5 family transposase n=1 Tax=Tunturiibacter gelidiferens TaxID=3069689 RepID=UPI003D9B1049